MAGSRELGIPNLRTGTLKEQLLRKTLRNVRSQGHPYVELREDGEKLIFFCALCLAPCYGDSNLFKHLEGNRHSRMLAAAKATLLKPNPWPFNDGMFFFHDDSDEKSKTTSVPDSERSKLLDPHRSDADSLAIVSYDEQLVRDANAHVSQDIEDDRSSDLNGNGTVSKLVIPSVLQNDEVSELVVRQIGVGLIGARFSERVGVPSEIRRIWCEWLGSKDFASEDIDVVPEHDFAVVTFSYNYNLGRKGLIDISKYLLPNPSSPHSEAEGSVSSRSKKRKSLSDTEDISEASSNQHGSFGALDPNLKMLLAGNDDQLVHSRILSSKTMRKELRDLQVVASGRVCDLCRQRLLPTKDVASLLNRKTGKLVCSSRNLTGAFHVFHVSCLLRWIMLCELEIHAKQSVEPKVKPRSRKKVKGNDGKRVKKSEVREIKRQIYSAFCPECQGTGIDINGEEELEVPTVHLSEIFSHKIKVLDAHRAWMKSPESLKNCSMGLYFPPQSDEANQEKVSPLKLLHFYRASD